MKLKKKVKTNIIEQKRRSYNTSFKEQAVALAKQIGMSEATEKLGLKNEQPLAL